MQRNFSNTAVRTALAAPLAADAQALTVADATGYPPPPFCIRIGSEVIEVGAADGRAFSRLARGYDGADAAPHAAGAPVEHVVVAADLQGLDARVYPRARGLLVFTWDDGYASFNRIADMAAERGQRHSFCISTANIDRPGMISQADLRRMRREGHEIASHSVEHSDLTGLNVTQRTAQYDASKAALEAALEPGAVTTYAPPFGARSQTTDRELYLRYDRVLGIAYNAAPGNPPYLYDMAARTGHFVIGRFSWDGSARARENLLSLVELAARRPVVGVVYGHDPGAADAPSWDEVAGVLDRCRALGVPCVTAAEAFPSAPLLRDGGFEDPALSHWWQILGACASVEDAPAAGLSGTRSLRLSSAGGASYVSQVAPVEPLVSYTLSGQVRVSASGPGQVYARLRQFDYKGALLSQTQTPNQTAADWAGFSLPATMHANAVYVLVDLILDALTGDAWFDHVHFEQTVRGAFG